MRKPRVNSVYKKELKTSVRSIKIALTLLGYNGILSIIGLIIFYAIFDSARYGGLEYSQILMMYTVLAVLEFGLVLFIIPAITAGAISGERERQTLEILLTTTMKPGQIIRGKLQASISTLLLLVFSSLPILSLVFSIGGVSFSDLIQFVWLIFVTAIFVGSLGLFFSVLFRKTTVSTVFSYAIVVFLTIGTIAIIGIVYLLVQYYNEVQYYNGTISYYKDTDLGIGILILLFNPAISIASMLNGQFGGGEAFNRFITEFGSVSEFIIKHWFGISMLVQLLASVGILTWASYLLNPLNRKSKKRKTKKKKK